MRLPGVPRYLFAVELPDVRELDLSEVQAAYRRSWARGRGPLDAPPLMGALRHEDPEVRGWLSHRLLDHGADASEVFSVTSVHVLLGCRAPDATVDVPILHRLLASGVDLNLSCGKWGRAIEELWRPRRSDSGSDEVADVMFAVDGLDLLSPNYFGYSVLQLARRNRVRRPSLVHRVEAYLAARGQLPVTGFAERASWQELSVVESEYDPARVDEVDAESGYTPLLGVLANPDLEVRTAMVPRLLADGADVHAQLPDRRTCLHLALGASGIRDPERDLAVLTALIEAGADVNAATPKAGSALNALADLGDSDRFEDFREVLLAVPELDPTALIGRTRTVMDLLEKRRSTAPRLLARVDALLAARDTH